MTTFTANRKPLPLPLSLPAAAPAAARAVFRLLQRLSVGTLDLQFPDGSHARFGHGAEPRASMRLNDWTV